MAEKIAFFMGAHNDDVEYCAGGLAHQLSNAGWKVHFLCVGWKRRIYLAAADSEGLARTYADLQKVRDFDEQDLRAGEALGAEKTILGDGDDSFFEASNQAVYGIKRFVEGLQPTLAFIHWPRDNHPDDVEASKACFKALSYSSSCEIHAFEAGPFQSMVYFYPDFFVNIESSMEKLKEGLLVFWQPTAQRENLYSGNAGFDALTDLDKRLSAALDAGIKKAQEAGVKVQRSDFIFPDLDPAVNYVRKTGK